MLNSEKDLPVISLSEHRKASTMLSSHLCRVSGNMQNIFVCISLGAFSTYTVIPEDVRSEPSF
jgi:hypothetical protein